MSDKTKVVIYGAGGYGGVGLVEGLIQHPHIEIAALVSRDGAGEPYSNLYPHLKGRVDTIIEDANDFDPKGRGEFAFFSTPDGVGQSIIQKYLDANYRVIDFSGDFRFSDAKSYKAYSAWQQGEQDHLAPELLNETVYGCPELYREKLKTAKIVGNPGCMAVSCLLAFAPALKNQLIDPASIVLDSKTGISGAGKKPKALFHFPAAHGNAFAYKVGKHQHVFEMEREFSMLANTEVIVDFTPHVIPTSRGILSTCYAKLSKGIDKNKVIAAYEASYNNESFVQIDHSGRIIELSEVQGSNLCRLSISINERTNSLIVASYIDNLQKGQSGNAIQVMNIMLGHEETTGLSLNASYPP